jgi:isochorismate hydrolase
MIRLESELHGLGRIKAADQETGSDQKNTGERYLCRDQTGLDSVPMGSTGPGPAAFTLQCRRQRDFRKAPSRKQPHGIEKIILIGMLANTCIESTGRFGMELGYHVTLVKDATAAESWEAMHASELNAPTFAHAFLSTQELLAALTPEASSSKR